MDDLRLQAVAARVVAWHNRHPLARRITAAQVKSIGYVAFGPAGQPLPASAPVEALPAATLSAATPPEAARPAHPVEEDFAQAFAELAAQAAAEEQALVPTQAEAAVEPAAEAPAQATAEAPAEAPGEAPSEAPAEGTAAANEPAIEIEVDVGGDASAAPAAAEPQVQALAEAAAEAVAETAVDAAAEAAADDLVAAIAEASAEPAAEAPVTTAVPGAAMAADAAPATAAQPDDAELAVLAPPVASHGPAPAASSLRDRVLNRIHQATAPAAPQGALLAEHRPAIAEPQGLGDSENFMAPLSPRRVARWVVRHGRALVQPPPDGPLRRVHGAALPGVAASDTLYVMTAAIEGGALRTRVLVGAGDRAAVLGPRLLSRPRVIAAATGGALLLSGAGALAGAWWRGAPAAPAHAQVHAQVPLAATAVPAAASAASAADHHEAAASAAVPASAPADAAGGHEPVASAGAASAADGAGHAAAEAHDAHAAAPAQAAAEPAPHADPAHAQAPARTARPAAEPELQITTERPMPAYAQKGVLPLPSRGPALSEADKAAARRAVADARAAAGLPPRPAPAAPSNDTAAAPAAAAAAAAPAAVRAAPPSGPVFAVSTRPLRTLAEAEQVKAAMTALLAATPGSGLSLELLPDGDDWRVVAWPYTGAADAERARALLASRGMKVQAIAF